MKLKKITAIICLITMASCAKVTIQPQNTFSPVSNANYEESIDFYLWGLIGEKRIEISKICKNGALQMQSQQTFIDGLSSAITLGIYAPHTAKVWCK
jgi:hypothetical protein